MNELTVDIIGGFREQSLNCNGCGKPLLLENAWMTDGCPCNTPLGINSMNETRWRLLMQLQQQQSREIERARKIEAAAIEVLRQWDHPAFTIGHTRPAVEDLRVALDREEQQPADVGYVFGGDARHYIQRLFDACGDGSGTLDAGWVMTVATKALEALYDRDEQNRPKIVCLCGSTRFWKTFQDESLRLTKEGVIVLSIGAATASDSEHLAKGVITAEQKEAFDKLHLAKVELADEILVLNVGGYIGESTSREIAHANKHRKRVVYLEQPADVCECGHEIIYHDQVPGKDGCFYCDCQVFRPKQKGEQS